MDRYSSRIAVKIILLSQLLSEAIDEAEGTTFYRHSLKNLIGKVVTKLQPFNRKYYDAIYDDDVSKGIDIIDTILDELTHCEVEGLSPIREYNLYMVKDSNGNIIKVKSVLEPDAFNKKYNTITK